MTFGVALLATSLFAVPRPASTAETQEVVLENGLKVLLLENHKSPAVTFQVWYRVGSRNEIDGKSGLSHFLEHMMFKGTAKTGPEEYSRIIAKNGGRSNAFTSSDVTVYFATMSRDKIGIAIDLEADRMANARLDGKFFEPEKKVIMEERRLRTEDNPVSALAEITGAVTYTVHPYRRPVIGWMGDIEGLTREDLREHYRTYYAPNNAFLVVVGDFSTPEILAQIKAAFGKIPRGPAPPRVNVEEPPQRGERRVILKKEAELPVLLLDYHVPNTESPDSFALDLLTTVLHEMGHVLGLDDQQVERHSATLMTETLPTGVRRSLLTDLPAGSVGQYPSAPSTPLTPQVLPLKDLLDRSLTTFAGS